MIFIVAVSLPLLWFFIMFFQPHPIFHDWKWLRNEEAMHPKCGPYDPRDDEQRKFTARIFICCKCGKEKRL